MIADEDDPKQRAFLIVLNNISLALQSVTRATRETGAKLDDHLTHYEEHTREEAALMNKGLGAWKVIARVLGVAQTVLIAGIGYVAADLKEIHNDTRAASVIDAQVELRLTALEVKQK